ncbi:unnamed protein product [Thelazia callipaeda]|uniref:Ras guanyl-releasing protein 3 n=1 Tax=Thelazia callipaeda TaxID=103827 RepID=A0A158RCQ5_THECL|nr:unnamed protein product [Thelazia callipaeda]
MILITEVTGDDRNDRAVLIFMTASVISLNTPLTVLNITLDGDEDVEQNSFPWALFHVHEWVVNSTELLAHFISLFQNEEDNTTRMQICRAVGYWIQTCPTHFDASLCRLVDRLKLLAVSMDIPKADVLLDLTSLLQVKIIYYLIFRPSYSWIRNISVRNPEVRKCSLSFGLWTAEEIAVSLSHIDYKALFRIPISELKQYCTDGNLSHTPILERSISIFNSLSNWVQCMVLNKGTPVERAEMITKFVHVAKYLKQMNNFNTLMAVIGGVTHSNIARLSKTFSALSSEVKKEISHFTQLLSSSTNFFNYRKALRDIPGSFCIPIMGVHLKDLISLQIKDREMGHCCLVSCQKILKLANHLSHFISFSRTPHNFPDANIDLIHTLKVSFDIRYSEDDIYHLSLKREPRTLLSFQNSAKSLVFADWASGVSSTLDSEIVNKHITAMVDAVFKNYDHNRDGSISQTEFQQISTNFPFIAPFGTIDTNKDGLISKLEMKAYFVKICKQSMEFRREFKHNFYETTFFTPALCAHCDKLLWGIIRQGIKCHDCGLVVHRGCGDSVVVECRRLSTCSANAWKTSHSEQTRPSRKLLPAIKSISRLRTFSATSERSAAGISSTAECSASTSCKLWLNLRSHSHKNRTRSETNDYYQVENSIESPNTDTVPSLACEEVFEDESPRISISDLNDSHSAVR